MQRDTHTHLECERLALFDKRLQSLVGTIYAQRLVPNTLPNAHFLLLDGNCRERELVVWTKSFVYEDILPTCHCVPGTGT